MKNHILNLIVNQILPVMIVFISIYRFKFLISQIEIHYLVIKHMNYSNSIF